MGLHGITCYQNVGKLARTWIQANVNLQLLAYLSDKKQISNRPLFLKMTVCSFKWEKTYFVIKNKEAVFDGFLLGRSPPKRTKSKSVLLLEFIKQWGRGYFFLYLQNWIERIQGKMESGAKLGSSKSRRRKKRVERLYHFAYLCLIVSEHWFWWAKIFGNYHEHG